MFVIQWWAIRGSEVKQKALAGSTMRGLFVSYKTGGWGGDGLHHAAHAAHTAHAAHATATGASHRIS